MRTMIDWSHWQDNKTGALPDLSKSRGVDCHYFRAGRGKGTVKALDIDPSFKEFVRQAKLLGLPWGSYWFHEPSESPAVEQARLFVQITEEAGTPDLPYNLNIEASNDRNPTPPPYEPEWIRQCVDEIVRLSGRPVILYTNAAYWERYIAPAGIDWSDCDTRIARWITTERPPNDPREWAAFVDRFPTRKPAPPRGFAKVDSHQFSAIGNGPFYGAESADLDLNLVTEEAYTRWTALKPDPLESRVTELSENVNAMKQVLGEMGLKITGTNTRVSDLNAKVVDQEERLTRAGEALSP